MPAYLQVVDRLSIASVAPQAQRTSAVSTVADCAQGRYAIRFGFFGCALYQ